MTDIRYHLDRLIYESKSLREHHAGKLWQICYRDGECESLRPYIPELKRHLHDRSRWVGVICARILYLLGEPPNLHTLMLVLEEDDWSLRHFALRFIIEDLGEKARPLVPLLYQLLYHKDVMTAGDASDALMAVDRKLAYGHHKYAQYRMELDGHLTWDDITAIID